MAFLIETADDQISYELGRMMLERAMLRQQLSEANKKIAELQAELQARPKKKTASAKK